MYNNGLPYPAQQPSMHFTQAAGPPRPPAQHFSQSWQPAGAAVPPGSFQPPAPQQFAADHNAFAGMFQAHLATLTFNSKPIITNLTVMAHENAGQMANTVARCIDEHITQVRTMQKRRKEYTLTVLADHCAFVKLMPFWN